MSAAAAELSVTHGAISRHIKSLEDIFGLALLSRGPRNVTPTPEGAKLASDLSHAFGLISASVESLKPGSLTLSCSSTIMMYRLIPRIGAFYARWPEIELMFNMNYDKIDFVRVATRISAITPPKDVVIKEMAQEWIGPVCSSAYLARHALTAPADLLRATLLETKTRASAWGDWARDAGHALPLKGQRAYDHFYLLIQTAACGLGLAMTPKMLVLDGLESGKLVAPFGFVPGPFRLVLWIAPHLRLRTETKALVAWLTAELRDPSLCSADSGSPRRAEL
jgi:DNA-binding transcriptional LysR family regulator